MGKSIRYGLYSDYVIIYLASNYDVIEICDVKMKKMKKNLSMVLTITILFSAMFLISNVAAQDGDPQGDPEDGQLRNCFVEDEITGNRDAERNGAMKTPQDRDEGGDPQGDPLKNRGVIPIY